jgi:hypothetical protein
MSIVQAGRQQVLAVQDQNPMHQNLVLRPIVPQLRFLGTLEGKSHTVDIYLD